MSLTGREKLVLTMRYGLGDGRPRTLGEIALHLNCSRQAVLIRERKALKKLRHPSRVRETAAVSEPQPFG